MTAQNFLSDRTHEVEWSGIRIMFALVEKIPDVVNLGIGIPTLCANYPSPDKEILYQTENGALNFGCNATPEEAD